VSLDICIAVPMLPMSQKCQLMSERMCFYRTISYAIGYSLCHCIHPSVCQCVCLLYFSCFQIAYIQISFEVAEKEDDCTFWITS